MTIRSVKAISLLLFFAAYSLHGSAQAGESGYTLDRLTSKVYVIHGPLELPNPGNRGFMNNPGVVLTSAGAVVIDPGGANWVGEMLLDRMAAVTDQPVVAVFNTHIHGDHWLGNQAIKARYPDAKIYAHPQTIVMIDEGEGDRWVEQMENMTDGATRGTVVIQPDTAITGEESVTIGDTQFNILHNGLAHTQTDIMIHAVQPDVVFLGDNVGYKRVLRVDNGSFAGNIAAIEQALALKAQHYVPGHGRSGGMEVPQSYHGYLNTLHKAVAAGYEEGLSDFEIKPTLLPKMQQWQSWNGFNNEFGKHISLDYLEIEAADF